MVRVEPRPDVLWRPLRERQATLVEQTQNGRLVLQQPVGYGTYGYNTTQSLDFIPSSKSTLKKRGPTPSTWPQDDL